jgi:hypothetical protein
MKVPLFERKRLWVVPIGQDEDRIWMEVRADSPEEALWELRHVRNAWAVSPIEVAPVDELPLNASQQRKVGFALND